jgi:hypothetical protein
LNCSWIVWLPSDGVISMAITPREFLVGGSATGAAAVFTAGLPVAPTSPGLGIDRDRDFLRKHELEMT